MEVAELTGTLREGLTAVGLKAAKAIAPQMLARTVPQAPRATRSNAKFALLGRPDTKAFSSAPRADGAQAHGPGCRLEEHRQRDLRDQRQLAKELSRTEELLCTPDVPQGEGVREKRADPPACDVLHEV